MVGGFVIVMPAGNGNIFLGYLAGKYEGQVGTMISPATGWMKPHDFLPYAIDNGKYADAMADREWTEDVFIGMLNKATEARIDPMFVVVPDVLFDRQGTIDAWKQWEPTISRWGFRLAMAVQDGMTPADIPSKEIVAFIGGSNKFKHENTIKFIDAGFDVHLARVNHTKRMFWAHQLGCMSCDGSGWFRRGGIEWGQTDRKSQRIDPLLNYLKWTETKETSTNLFGETIPNVCN